MPEPERCFYCDTWFDPASADAAMFHVLGACTDPDAEMTATGIRGVPADEPPQG
jgi:hypothetical protein